MRCSRILCAGLLIAGLAVAGVGSAAAQSASAAIYNTCLTRANEAPEEARLMAHQWVEDGGGYPAEHCLAVSLISLGKFAEAAERLELLSHALKGTDNADLRPDMLAQAGQAWVLAGFLSRATEVQSEAIELDPDNIELVIDRGLAYAGQEDYWSALDDFGRAYDLAPERPDVLTYRATAYRYINVPGLAMDDVERALEVMPDYPEALLERGILHRLAGNDAAARADWERVLEVAPDAPAAASARENLELLAREEN